MDDISEKLQAFGCPLPFQSPGHILIGHGSGGSLTHDLIKNLFQKYLSNEALDAGNDAAVLTTLACHKLVISTDGHIVSPLFFPGGDIGRLAVCGTVNDVAMLGAKVQGITASFIIEEGFALADLEKIVQSMAQTCLEAGVSVVAGDTKVTEHGKSDGLFISTAGFGWLPEGRTIAGNLANPGDAILISGPIGNHGVAIVQARGNLGFSSEVQSDVAPLNGLIETLLQASPDVHVLRDPTRGGLATTLVEIARQSEVSMEIQECAIPIDQAVRSVSEMLGLDPLYLANEGKIIIILPQANAEKALSILRTHPYGQKACQIGRVTEKSGGKLGLKTAFGTTRVLDMLAGEMLPRIC
ncbi:MAG: hydrogenase expression/formation protein HypE [Anaerolineaceae bacterium]|nr:hydrogenase expression/formation protein HypE [Anaerolineaceae bacterium]